MLYDRKSGHILVEVLLAIAIFTLIASSILGGFVSVRDGKVTQKQTALAKGYLDQVLEALRSIKEREGGWDVLAVSESEVYHTVLSGSVWGLATGAEEVDGFTRSITVTEVCRDEDSGLLLTNCTQPSAVVDPSVKNISAAVAWGPLDRQKIDVSYMLTRYGENNTSVDTSQTDFQAGQVSGTNADHVTGEVVLANNPHARWCDPTLMSATIDLPDGPPVAVVARANPSDTSVPNDVLVAVSPQTSNSIKLAYVTVPADVEEGETPDPDLRGVFTLDSSKYSSSGYVPTGIGLDNSFKTNDIKYYTSSSGKLYALLATTKPDKEVLAILVNDGDDGSTSEYQDPVNKIYKYHTFFNTRIYQGNTGSQPNQDQAPYGYGAVSLAVYEDRGYALSGGFLYVFNLANIDSKTTSSGLDMVGCRVQLDGYDCQPPSTQVKKYSSGQTGTSWGSTSSPIHSDCSDGGNIELYASNDVDVVRVGSSIYTFIAVGGVTNPELNIANVTNVPTNSTSPRISSSSCGTISSGNSGWRRVGQLDFNDDNGTEEASNSVYARPDGDRAYLSSNGGIDENNDGRPDSYQFYIINTSSKTSPRFISGTSSPPTSGYYYGQNTSEENKQLYPRRSLTVLNGERAVLVGRDGVDDDDDAEEYQVVRMEGDGSSEASPKYCGGVDFDSGFNDLVSVVEADSDSFVYMVANTQVNELKIIQGGEDGTYVASGYYESAPFDAGSGKTVMFNRVLADVTVPDGTSLSYKAATFGDGTQACDSYTPAFLGPSGTTDVGDVYTTTGPIPYFGFTLPNQNPARCFKYRAEFTSDSSRDETPVLNSFTVNYSP